MDHFLIFLQMEREEWKPQNPFKFNSSCLENEDLVIFIKTKCKPFEATLVGSAIPQFALNLKSVERATISWANDKRIIKDEE